MLKIARHKSDYTNEKPEEFENPVQYSFDETSTRCDIEDCNNSCSKMFLVPEVIMSQTFFCRISFL